MLSYSAGSGETVFCGMRLNSAEVSLYPAASSASRTSPSAATSVVTTNASPASDTSSAPASSAAIMRASSSISPSFSTVISPLVSNIHATQPDAPSDPPFLSNAWRTSAAVRFLLSVNASAMTATPPGA